LLLKGVLLQLHPKAAELLLALMIEFIGQGVNMSDAFIKDPGERLDYTIDWQIDGYLETGETISTSTWTVASGITQFGSATATGTSATIWLEGGTHGQEYLATNQIVTSEGRRAERSIKIICRNR
jgi:hypothetical protein